MTVQYIKSITDRYNQLGYTPYRWFHAQSAPAFQQLSKPISQSKLGVLSTSGGYVAGQTAYHYKDDTSVRAIPKDTPSDAMRFSHITENYLTDPRKDPDCIIPLRALQTLQTQGAIGEVASDVYTCMGGIYSQRRVREELIPTLTNKWQQQQVDAVLLVAM
jgi:D-proline reductase (dithiol) PrdB